MAESITIARPYARAAFEYAQANKQLEQWSQMLGFVAQATQDPELAAYLDQPQLTADQQASALIKVCGEKLDAPVQNLIQLLATNKRLAAVGEIWALYEDLLAEQKQAVEINVVSAFALSEEEQASIVSMMKKELAKEVSIQTEIDKELIGGVVITADDLVVDASIRGKLAKLRESLNS